MGRRSTKIVDVLSLNRHLKNKNAKNKNALRWRGARPIKEVLENLPTLRRLTATISAAVVSHLFNIAQFEILIPV